MNKNTLNSRFSLSPIRAVELDYKKESRIYNLLLRCVIMRTFLLLLFTLISLQSISQKKFETRIGLSYVISAYDAHSPYFSNYLENAKSVNGLGLKLSEEYYFIPWLSLGVGINLVNTNISFDESYISGSSIEKYRHQLNLLELDLPLFIKFSPVSGNSFRWFIQAGAEFRTIPYGDVSVNDLTGSKINTNRADIRIFGSPIAPLFGAGLDYKKADKRIGFFFEANYQYLIASYFYGGSKSIDWQSDVLIDNNHFLSLTAGVKF